MSKQCETWKETFFLLLYFVFCSVKSWERRRHSFILQAVFSSIVLCCGLPYTRFDFSRVPRSKTRECEGKVETVSAVLAALLVFFFHRFVCLSLHVSARFFFLSFFFGFGWNLNLFFRFPPCLQLYEEGREIGWNSFLQLLLRFVFSFGFRV